MAASDLKKHIVGGDAELVGVEHEPLCEQGEEPMAEHHLRLPPETHHNKVRTLQRIVAHHHLYSHMERKSTSLILQLNPYGT